MSATQVKLTILLFCLGLATATAWFRADGANKAAASGPDSGPSGLEAFPENFRQVSSRIYSGAGPVGREEFRALRSLGIGTVVSVDGAKPDLETARSQGLSYVHLPIGYSGVPMEVAASFREILNSHVAPVYIHCHHGKHRGPAAAAIAAMIGDAMDRETAIQFLEDSGASREYRGLWRDVAEFRGIPEGTEPLPMIASAPVNDLASAMAETDRTFDRLSALMELGNDAETRQEARHESTLLMESFREMARLDEAQEFVPDLMESEALSRELREKLATAGASDQVKVDIQSLKAGCINCHRHHRN